MTLILLVVATTRQAYTLLYNTRQPLKTFSVAAGTGPIAPHWGSNFLSPPTIGRTISRPIRVLDLVNWRRNLTSAHTGKEK